MKVDKKSKLIIKNTSMLLLLNIAKLIFPFVTLPYLTRVLSTECYGIVAYVKAVMSYMQVIIDFGFMLSATKRIVEVKNNKEDIGKIVGTNIVAKVLLAIVAGIILLILIFTIPILNKNVLYTLLSYVAVVLTIFLFDFLFKGIEQMQIITIRFVLMKSISTLCTFLFVKDDADILLIPLLEVMGTLVAVVWVSIEVKKLGIKIRFSRLEDSILSIKESAVYFMSNVATTSFNVFNTIILGIVLPATEIAYWSVCMQIVNAIQALYIPVSDAIYPEMIRSRDIKIVKKVVKILGPVILIGSVAAFALAKVGLYIVGGNKYIDAYIAFRALIPVIIFGFFGVIYGWPTLGAIGKTKETTKSTVIAACFQILVVILMWLTGKLTLLNMAVARSITEMLMFSIRYYYYRKNRHLFYVQEQCRE